MCLVDPTGVMFEVNPAFCSMVGYEADELRSTHWQDITVFDDLAADEELVAQLAAGDFDSYRLQKRYIHRDGSIIWGDLSVSCVRDPAGAVVFFISQIVDVTDSVNKLTAIAELEAAHRFQLVAEISSDIVVLTNTAGVCQWVSPSVQKNLGWQASDLEGIPISELFHPDDRVTLEEGCATREGARGDVEHAPFLGRLRTAADDYRWCSVDVTEADKSREPNADLVFSIRDVHDLVLTGHLAEEREARVRATLDSLLDPSVLLQAVRDGDGAVVDFIFADANDAACVYNQRPREELIGTPMLTLLPGIAESEMFAMYVHTVESGEPLILDGFAYPHEVVGSERHFDIRAVRVGDALSFTWRDVTDRHLAIENLRASEEQFRLLAQNSSDVVVRRVDGLISWASPSLIDTLGWHPNEWTGKTGLDFIHPDDHKVACDAGRLVEDGNDHVTTVRMLSKNGSYHWVDMRTHPYREASGLINGSVTSLRNVDAEVASDRELRRRAQYDGLTGILGRKEAFHRIDALFAHAPRLGGRAAVLFCDVDRFKSVNDTLGHAVGDIVLSTVAERLASNVRESDIVARIGGDEFLIVLNGVHDVSEATSKAEGLRQVVSLPVALPGRAPIDVTVSIGVTLASEFDTVDSAVARADEAMYSAKQSGANAVATD